MIQSKQIFVIYQPGMLGTFLCNLLTNNTEFQSDHGGLNTHASGYSDTDEMFHSNTDAERILGYTDSEQEEFFKKFKDKFAVHRLGGYKFIELPLHKFFANRIFVILKPPREELDKWAVRMVLANQRSYESEYYYKQIKDVSKVPEWFFEEMSKKEKYKWLIKYNDQFEEYVKKNKIDAIYFDPINLLNSIKVQDLLDTICDKAEIDKIVLPENKMLSFLEKNKKLFDNAVK